MPVPLPRPERVAATFPAPAPMAPKAMPWLYRGSGFRTQALAGAIGLAVVGGSLLLDVRESRRTHKFPKLRAGLDFAVGGITGYLALKALRNARHNRQASRDFDALVGQMNHHVRNALQMISFAAHSTDDQRFAESIRQAIYRIQWALTEVLPSGKTHS